MRDKFVVIVYCLGAILLVSLSIAAIAALMLAIASPLILIVWLVIEATT